MARIIISGGGTGGHVFPALAIANAIKEARTDSAILFVGAQGRMEMELIPAAGYQIVGLDVAGLRRGSRWTNIAVAVKLLASVRRAMKIIAEFKPEVVVGVGGYASFPTMLAAQLKRIPTIIVEQNSYAGVSNKHLSRHAKRICTAGDGMEKFFPPQKIIVTGTPVRGDLQNVGTLRKEAIKFFGIDKKKTTILVLGGSLGARTMNESMLTQTAAIARTAADVQWIWQAGKFYYEECAARIAPYGLPNVFVVPFIERMDYALAAADVVVSRAGAGAIAELAAAGKPSVLVPSPNVAEDHQTKNARYLEVRNAALVVTNRSAIAMLVHTAILLAEDEKRRKELSKNILALSKPNAAANIAEAALSFTR